MGKGPEAISGAFAFLSFFLKIFFLMWTIFYLFMAALGFQRCTSFSVVAGSGLLIAVASLIVEHRL